MIAAALKWQYGADGEAGQATALIFAFPTGAPVPEEFTKAGNPAAWADTKVEALLEAWDEGLSLGLIAKRMNITRGAVSAKCDRLGLKRPKPLIDGRSFAPHAKRPAKVWDEPQARRVPMWETTGCMWPVDEVDGVHLFCDAPKAAGRSYCECHHQRSRVPTPALDGR